MLCCVIAFSCSVWSAATTCRWTCATCAATRSTTAASTTRTASSAGSGTCCSATSPSTSAPCSSRYPPPFLPLQTTTHYSHKLLICTTPLNFFVVFNPTTSNYSFTLFIRTSPNYSHRDLTQTSFALLRWVVQMDYSFRLLDDSTTLELIIQVLY